MIYVYRRDASNGAQALAAALDALRYKAIRVPMAQKARQGDTIICWGEHVPALQGVKVLNGAPIRNKFDDAVLLKEKGVSTIDARLQKPAPVAQRDPAVPLFLNAQALAEEFVDIAVDNEVARTGPMLNGLASLITSLQQLQGAVQRPIPVAEDGEWLPRIRNHVGGNDLLTPPAHAEFWVKKENIVEEFRVHSFLGKSIRAGKKVHRIDPAWVALGREPHAWIRSWDGGWRIGYDGVSLRGRQNVRDLAHAAVRALGLDFGAVDIGVRGDGTLLVLEVNRAPGIEGGTVEKYADAIRRWMNGELAQPDQD
jgi:hypothetical protein